MNHFAGLLKRQRRFTALAGLVLLSAASRAAVSQKATVPELNDARLQVVTLKSWEANVLGHRIGPETAVHLSSAEYGEARKVPLFVVQSYVEVEIVVSEKGQVESAKTVGGVKLHVDEARQIEMARVFQPWVQDGVPVRVRVHDEVRLLPPEQWADGKIVFPNPWDLKTVTITLKRTRCYGTCPDYEVTVAGDGTVRFSGHYFVLVLGDHVAHIPPQAVRQIVTAFEKADFFSAKDAYRGNWTDNPTQTLTLTVEGRTKMVLDYVGTDVGLPLAIRNLEWEIDEITDTARWVKGDEQTLAALDGEKWPFTAASKENMAIYKTAISNQIRPLLQRYLAVAAPIISSNPQDASPVCVASRTGDLDLVRRMVKQATTKASSDEELRMPESVMNECLVSAARSGKVAMLQFWLDKGADPAAQSVRVDVDLGAGSSALENGVTSCKVEMVRKLLEVHAPMLASERIVTFAMDRGCQETPQIIELLAKSGADVNARGRSGTTPIFDAQFAPEAVKTLLAAGADMDARDDSGKTALISNAWNEAVVRELLAAGANPTLATKDGDTALKAAQRSACSNCVTLIESALNQRSVSGGVVPVKTLGSQP